MEFPFWIPSERDYPEDFEYENGEYVNICHICHEAFCGYKRRIVCKICSEKEREEIS